jgi:hypothetical protein
MPPTLTPQQFVHKWRRAALKERSAYQEHFIDLCRLVGHPTPAASVYRSGSSGSIRWSNSGTSVSAVLQTSSRSTMS